MGRSFNAITSNPKKSDTLYSPSLTETDIIVEPFQLSDDVNVKRLFSTETTTSSLALSAVKLRLSPSISFAYKLIVNGKSSNVEESAMSDIKGVSFTGITVNSNKSESVETPSETVTVIIDEPYQFSEEVNDN